MEQSTGGRIRSSSTVCGRVETAVGVIMVLFLFLEDASSDNMGNKESSVGTLSVKEGTSLVKFPTVEDSKRSFSLIPYEYYSLEQLHICPLDTNKARISVGDNENGVSFHL